MSPGKWKPKTFCTPRTRHSRGFEARLLRCMQDAIVFGTGRMRIYTEFELFTRSADPVRSHGMRLVTDE